MHFTILLLFVLTLSGCGRFAQGFGLPAARQQAEIDQTRSNIQMQQAQAQALQAQTELKRIELEDRQRQQWDADNRPAAVEGNAHAQYNLGNRYYFGLGVPQDAAQAADWYRKAADQGLAAAQYNLGVLYANGDGVSQDDAQATGWFRKAADQGDVRAMGRLDNLYEQGQGVPQDTRETVGGRLLAKQGDAHAQVILGNLYWLGEGVPQDYVQAHMWYNLAAAQGDKEAATARDQIAKIMTPEQIAEAQRLAREWLAQHQK